MFASNYPVDSLRASFDAIYPPRRITPVLLRGAARAVP